MYICIYTYICISYVYPHTHITLYVCVYICIHIQIHVCVYVYRYMSVCMYVCMYVFMYACTYVCMYLCMHVRMYVYTYAYAMDGWSDWMLEYPACIYKMPAASRLTHRELSLRRWKKYVCIRAYIHSGTVHTCSYMYGFLVCLYVCMGACMDACVILRFLHSAYAACPDDLGFGLTGPCFGLRTGVSTAVPSSRPLSALGPPSSRALDAES